MILTAFVHNRHILRRSILFQSFQWCSPRDTLPTFSFRIISQTIEFTYSSWIFTFGIARIPVPNEHFSRWIIVSVFLERERKTVTKNGINFWTGFWRVFDYITILQSRLCDVNTDHIPPHFAWTVYLSDCLLFRSSEYCRYLSWNNSNV